MCSGANPETCRALHYSLADNWMTPKFDDSTWHDAVTYAASDVTNQRAYVDHADLFGSADFIWSSNLKVDNQVICRTTIDTPPAS